MRKLVVCDLDGTLLPRREKELAAEVFQMIKELSARGISFAVASGRSYHELKRLFRPVEKEIYFIASDGALIVKEEKTLFEMPVPKRLCQTALMLSRQKDLPGILLCGKYLSYYYCSCPHFSEYAERTLHHHTKRIADATEIDGEIYKLSFYKKEAIAPETLSELCEIYDGSIWQDFIAGAAGKKQAVEQLLKLLSLHSEDVAVFGDNDNDAGMLSLTEYSYAVGEATQAAVSAAKKQTDNVLQTIYDEILNS